ncbi:MAG TPA: zf-HC2 domain-containing protein, partial [Mycobacterium sp.]|nr:zf-HC2 domain-containing protein [Mycobacterium sp.]
AVLDDRLDGKELEWARDHLRRCESCRERVEDFREMLLRVGRLPKAPVAAAAMDQAFAASVPERLRDESARRSFEITPADDTRLVAPMPEPPTPMLPEVTSVPDLMSELEREIFRDEPSVDHPAPLTSATEPIYAATEEPTVDEEEIGPANAVESAPMAEETTPEPVSAAPIPPPIVRTPEDTWREVLIDSHREPLNVPAPPEPATEPDPEPVAISQPEVEAAAPPPAAVEHHNVIYGEEPAVLFDQTPAAPPPAAPRKSDNVMRLAVGLGAAACVLLAAVLYEGGRFLPSNHNLAASTTASVRASHASASASARPSPSATATPAASVPPAAVLFSFTNGATGGTVFRIRPGTAVAGLTRLVFDIHGNGLPTMLITRPDDSHITVIFKNTTASGVPVNGIRSYHVSGVEPAVQQGADASITIDLSRPVRVTAFTLPATGSYAWRLVVDLHTS